MADEFEELGVSANGIRRYAEQMAKKFGAPIDYQALEPDMPASAALGSHGVAMNRWRSVEIQARLVIKHGFRNDDPSPFKICSALTVSLLKSSPIPKQIPDNAITERKLHAIYLYRNSLAAHTAATYCFRLLHKAKVGSENYCLEKPIQLSQHFFLDTIAALISQAKVIDDHNLTSKDLSPAFTQISLLYEAAAYITNPDAMNGNRIEFLRPLEK